MSNATAARGQNVPPAIPRCCNPREPASAPTKPRKYLLALGKQPRTVRSFRRRLRRKAGRWRGVTGATSLQLIPTAASTASPDASRERKPPTCGSASPTSIQKISAALPKPSRRSTNGMAARRGELREDRAMKKDDPCNPRKPARRGDQRPRGIALNRKNRSRRTYAIWLSLRKTDKNLRGNRSARFHKGARSNAIKGDCMRPELNGAAQGRPLYQNRKRLTRSGVFRPTEGFATRDAA